LGEQGNFLDYQGYFTNAAEAGADAKAQEHPSKHLRTEQGWDTVNGFFYAENDQAALALKGAQDQANMQPFDVSKANDTSSTGDFGDPSMWAGAAEGPVKAQPGGGHFIEGVGKSRYYTGVGMPHAEVRLKIQQKDLVNVVNVVSSAMHQQQHQQYQGRVPPPPPPRKAVDGGTTQQQTLPPPPPQKQIQQAPQQQQQHRPLAPPPGQKGILSSATFQYLAELQARKQQLAMNAPASSSVSNNAAPAAVGAKPPTKPVGGLLLADYGSDDEDD
jgi:hypothetical protein